MKRRRTSIVTCAVAASALVLAGCGGGADDKSTAGKEVKPGEVIELEYMHRLPDGEGMTPVQEIVDRWNEENPEVQVTANKWGGEALEMIKQLELDVNSGSAPCLAQLAYAEVPEMYAKGMLEDVKDEAEKYKDNFSGAYAQMGVGDAIVGLPQDTGPLVYFYDEAAFQELDLDVPNTVEELKEMAVKAAEQGKYILDFEIDEAQNWLSGQAAAAGDTWYGTEGDQWVVDTEGDGAQVVADFWQEMLDNDAALTHNRWDDAYTKAMQDGELIGNIGAAWEAGFMLDAVVPEDEEGTWKVAPLPDFGAGQLTGPDGGSGVAVMKGCEYPAQAVEFIDWFNRQTEDLATQGLVVAAKGDVTTPEKVKRQFGGQDVFAELAKANESLTDKFPYIPGFSSVGPKMNDTAAKVIAGEAKVADIFAAAQEASIAALKDLNLPVAD
ncbi:MAG: extracellular solute-binding protein [Bowdeniella nasicola]|nr:extracellular solute-binding protein [Bowdeniella nasicola]